MAVGSYNLVFFLGGALGGALSTALLQSRVSLPALDGGPEPGFTTAALLLSIMPLVAALIVGRGPNRRRPAESANGDRQPA